METPGPPPSPHLPARLRARAVAISLGVILLLAASPPPTARPQRRAQPPRARRESRLATEPYCGGLVAAGQLLLKVGGCSSNTSPRALAVRLENALSGFMGDTTLTVEQVGRGFIFLLKSNRQSVATLTQRINLLLNSNTSFFSGSTCAIEHIEPNLIVRAEGADDGPQLSNEPNDEFFRARGLWGLQNTGLKPCPKECGCRLGAAGVDVQAVPAWGITRGARRIVVAVLDNGIDYTHEDLSRNMWSAPDKFSLLLGGVAVKCLKGSHGFNALDMANPCAPRPTGFSHGTHVAGIIGAEGNNSTGVTGVNWEVSLLSLKFMDNIEGLISDAIKSIDFLLFIKQKFKDRADVRVINNSWGTRLLNECYPEFKLLREKIQELNDNEVLFVASAGNGTSDNDSSPHFPSNYPLDNVLAVTALDNEGRSDGVAHGKQTVHLGAPGQDILSTCAGSDFFCTEKRPYCYMGGTSMAAPHAAGAGALVLSAPSPLCSQLRPSALKALLIRTAVRTPSLSNTLSGGRLNVYAALRDCTGH